MKTKTNPNSPIVVYWGVHVPENKKMNVTDFSDPEYLLEKYKEYSEDKSYSFAEKFEVESFKKVLEVKANRPFYANLSTSKNLKAYELEEVGPLEIKKGNIDIDVYTEPKMESFINVELPPSWYFIASEPIKANFRPPANSLLPAFNAAYQITSTIDIGKALAPYKLRYWLPITSEAMNIGYEQPLFSLSFETDRPVIVRKFLITDEFLKYEKYFKSFNDVWPDSFSEIQFLYYKFAQSSAIKDAFSIANKNYVENTDIQIQA